MQLFVYGNLLSNYFRHEHLNNAVYVHKAVTLRRFVMIDLGDHPGIIDTNDTKWALLGSLCNTQIAGELYEVDDQTLAMLDAAEGHPHMFRRIRIETVQPSSTPHDRLRHPFDAYTPAYCYFLVNRGDMMAQAHDARRVVYSGDWASYKVDRENAKGFKITS